MSEVKQRLIGQNMRLAKASFGQAKEVSGLAKQSALNGGLRLSIEAYLVFFNDMFKPSSVINTMATADRFLRAQHRVDNADLLKLDAEHEYFFHADSAPAFFAELEPSLGMIASEWNKADSISDANQQLIVVARERLQYWANIEPDLYLSKLDNLLDHIQQTNDLSGEY